jgi:molecular chaperone HtpG
MEKTWEKVEGEKDEKGNDKEVEVERPRIINNTNPLWKKKPASCKEEDYKSFYRELYPTTFEEPLFHIHLNVDYPFNLTGILYFPKVRKNIEIQKDKIQLYSNQVFVTDHVEGIVPEFLTLLHGVIDSPDIPLNVSRSYLQSDSNVKKISSYIMRKVAEKLEGLFKKDRENFESKWDDIKVFIEYGMISEEKFYEKAEKFALVKNTEGKYFTFDEYKKHIDPAQKDKDDKLIILYANNMEEQHGFIQGARERGYDILHLDGILDNHFINTIEQKMEGTMFRRVDSDSVEKLILKEENTVSLLDEKEKENLKTILERNVEKEKFSINFENLGNEDMPFTVVQPEFMRRMKDMSALGGGYTGMGQMPDFFNLVVNTNHPLMKKVVDTEGDKEQDHIVRQLFDLALLSQSLLKGEKLTDFIRRSVDIIK